MTNILQILRGGLGALALVGLLAGCGNQGVSNAASAQSAPPPPQVTVVSVQKSDAALTQDFNGRVVANRTAEVRARVEGILEKRLFAEGGEVKEGQSLFRIDARPLEATVAAARAALAKSQANAEVAQQTVTRYRQLIADQGVSKQELDQAEAQLKQSQAEIISAKAAVERAQIDLDHAQVRAPISGRIGRALVTEGALVGHGEATHLATIEQLDPVYVDFSQSGSELLRLRKSMISGELKPTDVAVELSLSDGSRFGNAGKLLFSEQTVDPNTGTVTLRAQFPNRERLLLPGMFATVRLTLGKLAGAVKVPQRAVQATPQGQFVYVVGAENKVAPQPVQTGGFSGSDWIITDGLSGGERVVVDGIQKIRPGAVVAPVEAGTQPASNSPSPPTASR